MDLKNTKPDKELIACIKYLQKGMFDVKVVDIKRLAYQMLSEYNLLVKSSVKGEVGKIWEKAFFKQNKSIKPTPTSIPMTKEYLFKKMNDYFDTFTNIYNTHNIDSTRIYYLEVTKVAAQIMIIYCVNAAGCYIQNPMIILKESQEAEDLKQNFELSQKCCITISSSGHLTQELFTIWLENFIVNFKVTLDKRIVLYIDENNSKCKYFKTIQLAKNNGIFLIQVPTYKTMHLQPLLMELIKSFITQYAKNVKIWCYENTQQPLSLKTSTDLLLEAYEELSANQTASHCFKDGGIWPLNKSLFFNSFIGVMDNDMLKKNENLFEEPETSTDDDDSEESLTEIEIYKQKEDEDSSAETRIKESNSKPKEESNNSELIKESDESSKNTQNEKETLENEARNTNNLSASSGKKM